MNLPNKLTILRILLVPVFVACFYIPLESSHIIAGALFVIAYFTDMLDGRIARKYDIVTDFGKLMDPIADKILTAAAMIMLSSTGLISPIATLITISREFVISGFRLVSASKGVVIPAAFSGKLKTVTQFVGISLMLFFHPLFVRINIPLDTILIWLSVALAIWSLIEYIVKNNKIMAAGKAEEKR